MSTTMRAKVKIESVKSLEKVEILTMKAVAKNDAYPADGSDEDNTFARFTPSALFEISITNPDLIGKFKSGEKYYVDFTPTE